MKIGCTGSGRGLTEAQLAAVRQAIENLTDVVEPIAATVSEPMRSSGRSRAIPVSGSGLQPKYRLSKGFGWYPWTATLDYHGRW